MALNLSVEAEEEPPIVGAAGKDGAQGAAGPQGPAGAKGATGPRGPKGTSAKISKVTLARAPFPGSAKRSVKLLQRKTGKVVATGTAQGRKLRLSHLTSTKLKGSLRPAERQRQALGEGDDQVESRT